MLVDTHAHLYAKEFDYDRDAVIARARTQGVEKFYLPNVDLESIPRMFELEAKYPDCCFAMMGLHPCSVEANYKVVLKEIEKHLFARKFVAVGEIGLDYYWSKEFIEEQKDAFRIQCRWATELDIPIVIHARESIDDLIQIIREEKKNDRLRGIFHCFGGSLDQAHQIMELGFWMGIGGVLTYKKSGLDEIIKDIPLDWIVLEGSTIPFIARYRKEQSGGMDEVQIMAIRDEWERQEEIEKRQATILKAIEEQGKLTDELAEKIKNTFDLNLLEDIYLPYKKKRQTRAQKAREKGLEPLADLIWEQRIRNIDQEAEKFINDQVFSAEEALEGARDIIAERVNEHEKGRAIVREHFEKRARLVAELVKDKEKEAANYKDYFEFDKPLNKVQPHQLLAILRAESEGFLRFNLAPNEEFVLQDLDGFFLRRNCPEELEGHLLDAIEDAYKRLMRPSISTEFLNNAKEKADDYSIHIFAENLRQLLLASPLGSCRVLALDPGYATGCKLVCLSETGDLLENTVIYPTPPHNKTLDASHKVLTLVEKHKIEAIAVGNGTAGRETEAFVKGLKFGDRKISIFLVNESGASIYSASEIGRKEFPNEDVTVRGAVSIGRRLVDPLAELVKIDPKSIGVGQYQHDVDQKKLQNKLNAVVESCVNAVGVDLNTASEYLLTYVSGLGPSLAHNIVEYRKTNGAFKSRKELNKVARLGDKAFEQAAGFLRIRQAKNPLDNSAVHPEAYPVVEQIAKDLNCKVEDLIKSAELRKQIDLRKYVTDKFGLPTLHDIVKELEKPGRDPRETKRAFEFANIKSIDDLREGMSLPGIVTNIAAFGAFVDLGIKQNGLIHKSKMSHKFIQDPNEVLKLGQELEVTVVSIDKDRDRIQLSLID